MVSSEHIIDVTESDFQYEVIQFSNHKPVVVDFWAEWCGPCHMLGPILEELTEKADGSFRLAKVNVDENPNLALRYNVRSIPVVKGFRSGKVVAEFVGAVPKPKVEVFLKELAPSQSDLLVSKGLNLVSDHRWSEAEGVFRKVLSSADPTPQLLLGFAKSLLAQNKSSEAMEILKNFPSSSEYTVAEQLIPLAEALEGSKPTNGDSLLEARFERAINLVRIGNIPAALDGLMDILREDKRYRHGEVHKIVLALFELLGEQSNLTRQYQSELASVLF